MVKHVGLLLTSSQYIGMEKDIAICKFCPASKSPVVGFPLSWGSRKGRTLWSF